LSKLPSVDVPLDLHYDDSALSVQGDDVGNAATSNVHLTANAEQGLAKELIQVFPEQVFDFSLIKTVPAAEPAEANELPLSTDFVQGH
jgi:hypothetical protein